MGFRGRLAMVLRRSPGQRPLTWGCSISQHKENCYQDPKMEKCIQVSQENCFFSSITVQLWRGHGSSFASVLLL